MSIQRLQLSNGEIYHAVIRSVGDTVIFNDKNDFYRGVFSIYEFNNTNSVEIWERRRARSIFKKQEKQNVGCPTPHILQNGGGDNIYIDKRDNLVEILAFCFMPNHIHLLLRQIKDNGITDFMKKVGGGYANYFNKKYERKGHLFNRFCAVYVKTDEQLKNVFVYIHANSISLIEPGWKESGIENPKKVIKFLEKYKWSSYQDYLGKKNFPSVTEREFMSEVMDHQQGCREAVENWIKYKKEMKAFGDIILE